MGWKERIKKRLKDKKIETGKKITDKQMKRVIQLGNWNIRSLNGKEIELVDEFEKSGVDVLAITETKKEM